MTKRPPRLEADPQWMRPGPPRHRAVEDEWFRRAMSGVAPLRRRSRRADPAREAEAAMLRAAAPPRPLHPRAAPARQAPVVDPTRLFQGEPAPGRSRAAVSAATTAPPPGLDRRTAEKLRRGRIAIDARLDLHGMTQHAAHAAVIRTLSAAQAAGLRTVLIITGTGLSKKLRAKTQPGVAKPGILREALPHWLALPPLNAMVLAVSRARIEHGGEGARYVLLRRQRR